MPNRNEKSTSRRVPEKRDDFFTLREIEFLNALKRFKRVKEAASEIRVTYRRGERILANIRKKWRMAVNTNNRLLNMTKRDPSFTKLLYSPARLPPDLEIEEEKEEELGEEEFKNEDLDSQH